MKKAIVVVLAVAAIFFSFAAQAQAAEKKANSPFFSRITHFGFTEDEMADFFGGNPNWLASMPVAEEDESVYSPGGPQGSNKWAPGPKATDKPSSAGGPGNQPQPVTPGPGPKPNGAANGAPSGPAGIFSPPAGGGPK